jgi:parallel beta-helix repeat protein
MKSMLCLHVVLLTLLLASGSLPLVSASDAQRSPHHDPIVILGDSDFTPANGVVGGVGTVGDPYVIEDWEIDASQGPQVEFVVNRPDFRAVLITFGQGILIANTTAHLIIRNVYVHDGMVSPGGFRKDGISLVNLVHARIEDSRITRNGIGIRLEKWVRESIVGANRLVANIAGIAISDFSDGNTVTKNTVIGGLFGIEVGLSRNNTIYRNRVESQIEDGILVGTYLSSGNLVTGNLVVNNGKHGVKIIGAHSNVLSENVFIGNDVGLSMIDGFNNQLSKNLILSNRIGVELIESPPFFAPLPNVVSLNIIIYNDIGMFSCASTGNILEPNILRNNNITVITLATCP